MYDAQDLKHLFEYVWYMKGNQVLIILFSTFIDFVNVQEM